MSYAEVKRALESHLDAMQPALPTQWEGVSFTPPGGEPWQSAATLFNEPVNDENGSRALVTGFFQVTLFEPFGEGTAWTDDRIDALAAHFPKNAAILSPAGLVVTIRATAHRRGGYRNGGFQATPVRVFFRAQFP